MPISLKPEAQADNYPKDSSKSISEWLTQIKMKILSATVKVWI